MRRFHDALPGGTLAAWFTGGLHVARNWSQRRSRAAQLSFGGDDPHPATIGAVLIEDAESLPE